MMPTDSRNVLFSQTHTLDAHYEPGADPRPLQLAFAALFDQAAQAVYRAGADLDEVLVERVLMVRTTSGSTYEVDANFLSDAVLLKNSILAALAPKNEHAEGSVVVGIRLTARRDQMEC